MKQFTLRERWHARFAYDNQRRRAEWAGIGWEFTFESWLEWWGEDLFKRGVGRDQLSMQRIADSGPYSPSNVRKGTPKDNARTAGKMKRLHNTLAAKQSLESARDQAEPIEGKEIIDEESDEFELNRMFGVRNHPPFKR